MAEHGARLAEPRYRRQVELAGLAHVVEDRGAEQHVRVETRMQHAGLLGQRGHGHGVLQQPAQVGVMPGARAGRAAQLGAEALVAQEGVQQRHEVGVVDLAREVLQEAVELLDVAVGHGEELRRIGLGGADRPQVHLELIPKALDAPGHGTRSPRSNWSARKSASRTTRVRGSRRCDRAARRRDRGSPFRAR